MRGQDLHVHVHTTVNQPPIRDLPSQKQLRSDIRPCPKLQEKWLFPVSLFFSVIPTGVDVLMGIKAKTPGANPPISLMYLVSGLFDAKQKLTKEKTEDPQRLKFSHSFPLN